MKTYVKFTLFIISFSAGIFFLQNFNIKSQKAKSPKFSGAMEAMKFWSQQRTYPFDNLPSSKYNKAFEKRKLSKKAADIGSDEWEQIGPHNIGGRTISLALNNENPNTIYAGSASGGLWRSYTAGVGKKAWNYIPTGFPVLGVGAIAISPADTNTIFIGTGEVYAYKNTHGGASVRETRGSYGIGILKTTDAGKSWVKSLDWSFEDQTGVWSIEINPKNPNTIFAGTTEGTYRSYDQGKSWQKVHSVVMVSDIYLHPVDTNIVIAACGNLESDGTGFYRSTDAGNTWNKITAGLPSSYGGKALISNFRQDPDILYASIGNGYYSNAGTWLCRSTNAGETWIIQNTYDYSTYQGWFAHFAVVNPEDDAQLLLAGVDVFKSSNYGVNLNQKSYWYKWYLGYTAPGDPEGPDDYSHADHHTFVQHPTNSNIVYFGNDGGVFVTTDFGETFEGRNGGYQSQQFYNGFYSSQIDSNLAIGGLQDNATAIYKGKLGWTRVIGGDGSWAAMSSSDYRRMFGSYQYLSMLRSTDAGNSWTNVAPPSTGQTPFIAPYVISPQNHNILYAARSIIYKSTNSGTSWTATNGGAQLEYNLPLSMEIAPTNDNVVYVGFAPSYKRSEIYRTTNGGTNWLKVTNGLPDRYPTDIAISPSNPDTVYVVYSGFGTDHIFRTGNSGGSWTSIQNGLPDIPFNSVAIDPENTNFLYAGTDLGIFASTNNGETWNEFSSGLPEAAIVSNLTVSPLNRKLRASTHGHGAYERNLLDVAVSVNESPNPPEEFALNQNYPNPFNPETNISFTLPQNSFVNLSVFTINGELVKEIVNEVLPKGAHNYLFSSKAKGMDLASGTYIYRLKAGNFAQAKKMILLK